jgi:hypothetical protein
MPSTMLGHERPPRRARPDDHGQLGAGDAGRRSDAARSAARPDTDTGGAAIAADTDAITAPTEFYGNPDGSRVLPAGYFNNGFTVTESEWHEFADDIGICDEHPQPHCLTCTCARTASDAGTLALNPDSDPAT